VPIQTPEITLDVFWHQHVPDDFSCWSSGRLSRYFIAKVGKKKS
jgi:hypothetical protein